jgi:hypothetical protein
MKITIATPMYGGFCTGQYTQGVISTISKLNSLGIKVDWLRLMNESLITRARNELTRIFLNSDSNFLMFIDSDISFDENAVLTLIKADKDISCGIYPAKEINWQQIKKSIEQKGSLKDYSGSFVVKFSDEEKQLITDKDGMIEIDHGGTGFMLIKRQVFETLYNKVPEYRSSNKKSPTTNDFISPITKEFFSTSIVNNVLLSEDYHFCNLWKKNKGKIFMSPFIKLEHVGTYEFTGNLIETIKLYN